MNERVWVPDRRCRVVRAGDERRCRMLGCGQQPVVMEIKRTVWRRSGPTDRWWAYCAEHTYGRRIEGDVVLCEVAADSPAAERGWIE